MEDRPVIVHLRLVSINSIRAIVVVVVEQTEEVIAFEQLLRLWSVNLIAASTSAIMKVNAPASEWTLALLVRLKHVGDLAVFPPIALESVLCPSEVHVFIPSCDEV